MKLRLSLLAIPTLLIASFAAPCLLRSVATDNPVLTHAEEEPRSVYFRDSATKINAGNENWAHVAIDEMANLTSIKISIHFLQDQVTIENHGLPWYADRAICHGALTEGCLTYSIVYQENHEGPADLIDFSYFTKPGVFGSVSFLITVEDAYDSQLEPIEIHGTSFSASIIETSEEDIPMKEVSFNLPGTVYMKPYEKKSVTILATGEDVRAGGFEIRYDPDQFHYLRLRPGWNLDYAGIVDVAESRGVIRLSFASDSLDGFFTLASLEFCVKEEFLKPGIFTYISILPTAFYDGDFHFMIPYATYIQVCYDQYNFDSIPISSSIAIASPQSTFSAHRGDSLDVTIRLGSYSFLGAGDFVFTFDPSVFQYLSYVQRIECDIFVVNVTKSGQGILAFSILSAKDLIAETDVLTIRLKVANIDNQPAQFTLTCKELTTSSSNPIQLESDPGYISINPLFFSLFEFCQAVLDATNPICATGHQDNRAALESVWPDLKEFWLQTHSADRYIFSISAYDPNYINGLHDEATMRYDYIVRKYGLENFAGREIENSPMYPSVGTSKVHYKSSKSVFYLIGAVSFFAIVFTIFVRIRNKHC